MLFLNPIFWISILIVLMVYYNVQNKNIKNLLLVVFSFGWYIWYTKTVSLYLFSTILTTWFYGKIYEKQGTNRILRFLA